MSVDPLLGTAFIAYGILSALWVFTVVKAVRRMKATGPSSPLISRLYLALVAGSVCAIAACANEVIRLVFSTGALGGAIVEPRQMIVATALPFCANAAAFALAIWLTINDWLPQILRDEMRQRHRRQELEELVEQRTQELRETIGQLEQDHQELERISTELRAEHAMLGAVMNANIGAICVANVEGKIVFANDAAQRVVGVTSEEITKRSCDSPQWGPQDLNGRPLAKDENPFARVMRARCPVHNMHVSIADSDGARRILEINGAPLFDDNGAVSGVVFLSVDVTKRMADEAILRDSESRFRQMVEDLPSGAVFLDGECIYLNRAAEEITGYSRAELTTVSQWFWALYGEASADARAKYESVRDIGFPVPCVGTIRRKDGEMRVIECDGYNSNNATVWLLHDISDQHQSTEVRRRFESHLYQTQSLANLAVMAEGVAHDCNNILTGIVGSADLARHELEPGNSALPYLAEIAQGAERAADLCTMIMACTGDADLALEAVDVNEAIREMARFMQGAEGYAPGVTVKHELDESAQMVRADAAQLRKVLLALLKNAAEAIGTDGGTITVSTGAKRIPDTQEAGPRIPNGLQPGSYVSISVADTGSGMDENVKAKAFDPFFTTKPDARGLGLTYAFAMLRACSGNIVIESEQKRGTTVTVYLPVAHAEAAVPKPHLDPDNLWHGTGTILVVDDEINVRTITKRMLEKLGFDVVLATNGFEAIEMVELRPDLAAVILDLTMPNLDGGAAFERIRECCPRLPVLIASGYDVKKVTNRFPRGGVASFLQKPYPMRVLSEHLRDALAADAHSETS